MNGKNIISIDESTISNKSLESNTQIIQDDIERLGNLFSHARSLAYKIEQRLDNKGETMSYLHLINYALSKNYSVQIDTCDDTLFTIHHYIDDRELIKKMVERLDHCHIAILDLSENNECKVIGCATLKRNNELYGGMYVSEADDDSAFMNEWGKIYWDQVSVVLKRYKRGY